MIEGTLYGAQVVGRLFKCSDR